MNTKVSNLQAKLRIHGKIPRVEAITRSEAMRLRNGIMSRLQTFRFFQNFTFRRSHPLQILPDLIPYCCVYFMSEELTPDGDLNAGSIRFGSIAKIGFSIIIKNNDPDAMEDKLDDAYQAIFHGLLEDPTFYRNKEYLIEGFSRGGRTHSYGTAGNQSNETPYAELRAELHCDLDIIEYEPRLDYMLETIHVETIHPPGAGEEVQRVTSVYDMDQGDDDAS